MNFSSEEYMDNIQTSAYIGMGLNIAVVMGYLIAFRNIIKSESGHCRRFKLIMKILYAFFWPVADSITGTVYDIVSAWNFQVVLTVFWNWVSFL